MALERCSCCSAPIYVRLAAVWNDDGTVTGRFAGHTRVVQIYAPEINHVLNGISERIGLDISRIVVEGERKAGIEFTRDVLSRGRGLVGAVARNRLFTRFTFGFVLKAARNAGLGKCRMAEYRHREMMVIEFESPFNIPILAGDMLGAFEAFARRPGEVSWEGDSHFARITIKAGEGTGFEESDRLRPILPPTIPGNVSFERCPKCRMPLGVTRRYSFDLDEGIATEVTTGRRIVTVIIDSLNAIFRELEDELGEEVNRMIVELESDFVKENAPRPDAPGDEKLLAELLDEMRIKGMGNPAEVTASETGLRVRIDNPFCEELLAGRILGYYRALWGEPATVDWTPDTEGFMVVEVGPDDHGRSARTD